MFDVEYIWEVSKPAAARWWVEPSPLRIRPDTLLGGSLEVVVGATA